MEQSKYANSVSIAINQMDARLIFSNSEPCIDINGTITDGGREEVAKIVMSLTLAKRFNKILAETIANYEAQNGSIPELNNGTPASGHKA